MINYIEEFENCSSDYKGNTIDETTETITITADVGYKFKRSGTYDWTIGGMYVEGYVLVILDDKVIPYNLGDGAVDEKGWVAKIPIGSLLKKYNVRKKVKIIADTTFDETHVDNKEEPPEDPKSLTDLITIFKLSFSDLNNLATISWSAESFSLADFIYKIYELPISIPPDLIGDNIRIKVGGFDTLVDAPFIKDSKIIIDLGIISVPSIYGNVYDYNNTTCLLYIPYLDAPIELSPDYVIDQEIQVFYTIDLYNGRTFANITSSVINKVIQRVEIPLTREIPFPEEQQQIKINTIGNYRFNDLTQCVIEVIRNTPYDTIGIYGKALNEYGVIGDYTNYIEVDKIILETTATNYERQEIEQLLKQGIYINS